MEQGIKLLRDPPKTETSPRDGVSPSSGSEQSISRNRQTQTTPSDDLVDATSWLGFVAEGMKQKRIEAEGGGDEFTILDAAIILAARLRTRRLSPESGELPGTTVDDIPAGADVEKQDERPTHRGQSR